MQWTGCHGEERHGGDRCCVGGCNGQGVMVMRHRGDRCCVGGYNGQGVMVMRHMEVTDVVEEDAVDRVSW